MKTSDEIKKGLKICYEYIDCSACPYVGDCFDDDVAPYGAVMPDALAYIQQLEEQVPKWISVEKPPKEPGEYIILIRYPDGRHIKTWGIFHPDCGWCPTDLVEAVQTHWMSFYALPEPPKEDDKKQ